MHRVNWWAIVVSAIVFFLIGWLWYGMLFTSAWMTAMGKATGDMTQGGAAGYEYGLTFVMAFLLAYGLARILSWRGDLNPGRGALIGLSMGLLIFGTMTAMDYTYEMRGSTLAIINVGYVVVGMAVMGVILGAWKPKAS